MDKKKILGAKVPYIELFGVDGMGKGRPAQGTAAAKLGVTLDLPYIEDMEAARAFRSQAKTRALTVLKTLYAREYRALYGKELDHLVKTSQED